MRRARGGFTLIEIMISVTILLVIIGAAVQFLRRQTGAVSMESQRMDALQNAQFAASQMERELRAAGTGVADEQPMIVQLDSTALTFNANLVSTDPADVRSVYRHSDIDPAAARAMLETEALPLPNSNPAHTYPDTTYFASKGVQSGAETISYYLTPDAQAATANTWALYRRVNARPATLVARNIVRATTDSIPFFTYFTQDTLGRLIAIPRSRYPLYHTTLHGAPNDTGQSARTDSVRLVRLHFVALTVDRRAGRDSIKYRVVETRVRLMNAGLLNLSACGVKPTVAGVPVATPSLPGAAPRVTLSWAKSGDDGANENDIERYAIFRRLATDTDMGDPIASVPAGISSGVVVGGVLTYNFIDTSVVPGQAYVYGIAAQDCTPKVSDITQSLPVTVNP